MTALHPAALAGSEMDRNDAREGHHFIHIGDATQRAIARFLINRFGVSSQYATAAALHICGRVAE